MMSWLRRRSLFSSIVLHGLVVLVASAAAFVAISVAFVLPHLDRDARGGSEWLADSLCQSAFSEGRRNDPPRHVMATAYSPQGQVRNAFGRPALLPLGAADVARLRAGKLLVLPRGRMAYPCVAGHGGGYVVMQRPGPPPFSWKQLLVLIAVVIPVVTIASIPFARSIAKPMERMVAVTRAFGRGDLGARAEATRKDEVGALATAFNEMAEQLERLIRSEKEFLANVSHELRTPMARIRVVLETAQEDPPRAHALLKEIGIDLADLEGLVENVMESMRLDMGSVNLVGTELPVSFRAVQMNAVGTEAVERFRRLHPHRRITLTTSPDSLEVMADPQLLRRLLDNLLENARKYSNDSDLIAMTVKGGPDAVMVEVMDEGIGIDPEDLAHVFKPFFRGDRSRSRETGGAGLGLSLAKRIADAHQGTLAIESHPGQGTAVQFSLPRHHI